MIHPTSNLSGFYRADAIATSAGHKTPAGKTQTDTGESLSRANTDSLREALVNTSEIRSHVVERGRKLAVDPTYPPREIIASLTKLLLESRDISEKA